MPASPQPPELMPGQRQLVAELLVELESAEPDTLEAILRDRSGGDEAVCREVRALHALADSVDDDFLGDSAEVPSAGDLTAIFGAMPTDEDRAELDDIPALRRVGPYEIESVLGSGGMGTVYCARHEALGRRVALKVPRRGLNSAGAVARFRREARILATLDHPGIARIYEADIDGARGVGGVPYIAMELVEEGRSLTRHAREEGLDQTARLALFADACAAVAAGHVQAVVHCDIKAGNLLVDRAGRVRVIDFGIARATLPDVSTTTMTTTVQFAGSLRSMSPEQATGGLDAATPRSDVYGLGTVLYELLTDAPAFPVSATSSLRDMLRSVAARTPPRLRKVLPHCPVALEAIVAKALAPEPERRYADAHALEADVRRFLDAQAVDARPEGVGARLGRFVRRRRVAVLAAVIALVLAGPVAMGTFIGMRAVLSDRPWPPTVSKLVVHPDRGVMALGRVPTETGGELTLRVLDGDRWRHIEMTAPPVLSAGVAASTMFHDPGSDALFLLPNAGEGIAWSLSIKPPTFWSLSGSHGIRDGMYLDRDQAAIATGEGRVWLHGGVVIQPDAESVVASDLMMHDGASWTMISAIDGPGPRFGHQMVLDEHRRALVVVGGRPGGPGGTDGSAWEFLLAEERWARLPGLGQDADDASLVYHAASQAVLMWTADGVLRRLDADAVWRVHVPAGEGFGAPGPRRGAAILYDRENARVILHGGQLQVAAEGAPDLTAVLADTWVLVDRAWRRLSSGRRWTRVDDEYFMEDLTALPQALEDWRRLSSDERKAP